MQLGKTSIEGLFVLKSPLMFDNRGFFRETFRISIIEKTLGRKVKFKQNNHSRSHPGVLRGFHREAWDKLFYVIRGTAFVAVADTRPDSDTFGKHETFLLGDAPGEFVRVFISKGLSNAFYCMTEVDYINEVSNEFDPAMREGVHWADPTLNVKWPSDTPILSDADSNLPPLKALLQKTKF